MLTPLQEEDEECDKDEAATIIQKYYRRFWERKQYQILRNRLILV